MMRKWTEEQINYLKENYPNKSKEELLENLPYTWASICTKARENKIVRRKFEPKWTEDEKEFLRQNYPNGDKNFILSALSRYNWGEIQRKANSLKIVRNIVSPRLFTEEDIQWLKDNYSQASLKEIKNRFPDIDIQAVRNRANSFGLKMDKSKRDRLVCGKYCFTKDDEQWLINNYQIKTMNEIIEHFDNNFTSIQIYSKASKLGLKRDFDDYTQQEIDLMKNFYDKCKTVDEFCKKYIPNRTVTSITTKAYRLGIIKRKKWTKEEDQRLIDNYYKMFRWQLVKLFPNKPKQSVFNRIIKLGLSGGMGYAYREEDNNFIRDNYLQMTDEEIGTILHRAAKSIKTQRNTLGYYRKNLEIITSYVNLNRFIARHENSWRKESIDNWGELCILSDKQFEHIHHLYSRNLIVDEVGKYFNLPDDFDICQCDKKFRDRIVAKYRQIVSQHPLGVPLTEEIHIKFHTFYGFGNNTPEQFLDFVSRFYPEKLEMIKEYLKNN